MLPDKTKPNSKRWRIHWNVAFYLLCFVTVWSTIYLKYIKPTWRIGFDTQKVVSIEDKRIVFINIKETSFKRGDIIAFKVKNLPPFRDGQTVIKYADGLPGDKVTIQETEISVNGQYVTEGLDLAGRFGKEKAYFQKTLNVPEDGLYVLGRTPNSVDSRYFGPIPKQWVIGKVYDPF